MKEWITYMRYCLISNLLIIFFVIGCDTPKENVSVSNDVSKIEETTPLTRKDSLIQIAKKYGVSVEDSVNVHEIMNAMIVKQKDLLNELEDIENRADQVEKLTYEYKKKEDAKLQQRLMKQIQEIKDELERIKKIASEESLKKEATKIEEKLVDIDTKTFENLPAGSYITRLDSKRIIRILVKPNGEIIVVKPVIDSTTIIRGKKVNPRLKKELEQIRKQLKGN